ncbi:MAG TPA: CusA/CzcA family heavy metal efflux RND transporter [Methylomirabilota bacterium]|nr:CusA/CzcA family heavy metal efflux RND transporter [Methylomirabilota bacterium]
MIDRILEFSLRQRAVVLLGAALLLGFGLWSARELPIDAVPDITSPQVQINTEVPALAPEEAEMLVTRVLEQELAGLPGVTEMRSLTKFGLAQVTLQFRDDVDIYRSRQLVAERIQAGRDRLPAGVEPRLSPISTGLGEIFYYTLAWRADATNRPAEPFDQLLALHEAQEYIAKPFLRAIPGVAEINSSGGHQRQIIIQPDPGRLREANLSFDDLAAVIRQNTDNAGGGIINQSGRKLIVRAVSKVQTIEDLANLPLKFGAGARPLLVKDVAEVAIGSSVRAGAATENGVETVLGTVMMLAGENSRVVAHRVGQRIRGLQEKLPPGIEVRVQYDRAELVDRTIHTVKVNLFEGAVLVVAVLLGLLGNWRAALIVATAIPLSFLCALIGMARLGVSGNLMSLGAVDFGLIIDGAVVIVENIVRQLAHRQALLGRPLTAEERARTVLAAARQVGGPMFHGVLIIAVVYLPILALGGIEGKMFHPMALTVMLALGGALVLALTLMPALCAMLLGGKVRETENLCIRWLKGLYRPALDLALRRRWGVVGGAVALFALALVIFTRLGAEFVPKLDEGATTMMLYRPVDQSIEASVADQCAVEQLVRQRFPEVERVFSRIGTSEVATDPMPPNEADLYVFYKPRSEWRKQGDRVPTKRALAERVAEAIQAGFTNTDTMVAQPIEMRFNEMLEGVRADLSVKVFGPDFDMLEALAERTKAVLEKLPGVAEIEFETEGRPPVLTIAVRREELVRRNLTAASVNAAIVTALAGQTVGTLQHGTHVHEVVVRLRGELREQVEQIRALPVRAGDHGLVPLGALADIRIVPAVEPIRRDDGKRRAALMINLDTSDVEGWVNAAHAAVREQIRLPEGYQIEFGGQFEHLQEARARLAIVVPAALALIFVLIFVAFGSLRQAALVYTGIPLALTGGIFALWLRGMPFSITAAVGFIALSGVAVLNGVVMVSCFNELREEGRNLLEAVKEGALTRLRPVLMTAAVAALGFVPMALSRGAGAEVQRPLATVVIGGILSSTFLTLFLLPVLYAWCERRSAAETGAGGEARQPARPAAGAAMAGELG